MQDESLQTMIKSNKFMKIEISCYANERLLKKKEMFSKFCQRTRFS